MLEVSWGVPQRAYMFQGNRGVPLQNRKQAHGGPPSRAAPPPASAPPPLPSSPHFGGSSFGGPPHRAAPPPAPHPRRASHPAPLRWSRPWVASTLPSQAALRPSWPPLWWHCCWLLAVAVIAAPRIVLTAVETVLAIIKKCVLVIPKCRKLEIRSLENRRLKHS